MKISDIIIDKKDSAIIRIKTELNPDQFEFAKSMFKKIADELLKNKNRTFDIAPVEGAVESIIKWLYMIEDDKLDFTKGILFKGPTGRGKTFLFRVMKYFSKIDMLRYIENGVTMAIEPQVVNVKKIAGEFQSPDGGGYQVIRKYSNFRTLVLDDIGIEQEVSQNFGNKGNVVEDIINIREEKGLLTFGTTNLDTMSDMYDDRTISRMYALFNVIVIDHKKDFRQDG